MENKLLHYFDKLIDLSPEEREAIANSMVICTFKKDTLLLKEGQYYQDTYFILNGCIRQYKIVDGEEITTNVFTEEQWIISLTGFEDKIKSPHYLICVEDTTLVIGDEKKSQELFVRFPRLEAVSRKIVETVFQQEQQFMSRYITDTPEQRYLNLLQSKPDIFQRLPQYHIATYIGVKPESLSRIRKKLAKKKIKSRE